MYQATPLYIPHAQACRPSEAPHGSRPGEISSILGEVLLHMSATLPTHERRSEMRWRLLSIAAL